MTTSNHKILIVASSDSAYVGADTVGQGHNHYAANTYVIKVVSPAMLPIDFYLHAFSKGIDGIIVMSSGEETPFEGAQHRLTARLDKLTGILKGQGIDFRRVKLSAICTVCTASFLREVKAMNDLLGEIGSVEKEKIIRIEPLKLASKGGQL